jgi:serine phosphatase RsbU (regulator of sigma subunit)
MEAENERGEFFERDRILSVVGELCAQPARHIVVGLHRAIESFRSPGPQADDVTAVVGRVLPAVGAAGRVGHDPGQGDDPRVGR